MSDTGGDNKTRTAVAKAIHEQSLYSGYPCSKPMHDAMADAAISAYEASPPSWLTAVARAWHQATCVGMGRVYDNGTCSAVPRAVRVAAGIEEEG